jgi:hypothetical protein
MAKRKWSKPSLVEVPHDSPEFWEILGSLTVEERAIVKSPEIGATLRGGDRDEDGRGGGGLEADAHRYRWRDIDAGGRPPRDRAGDETLCNLVDALTAAPSDDLCGKRGQRTRAECERYLKVKFPEAPRKIIRTVVKHYLSP